MNNGEEYKYLESRHGSLYRQPFVKGSRIRVEIPYGRTVAKEDDEDGIYPGEPVEEIAEDLHIPVEAVLEAIDYCTKHWDVVVADHAREDRLMDANGMNHPDYKHNPAKYYRFLTPQERSRIINDEPIHG